MRDTLFVSLLHFFRSMGSRRSYKHSTKVRTRKGIKVRDMGRLEYGLFIRFHVAAPACFRQLV